MKIRLSFVPVVVFCCNIILAEENNGSSEKRTNTNDEKLVKAYRKVFKQKRLQQMLAAENLLMLKDYARQYKMVKILLDNLFKVLQESKTKVVQSGYTPGDAFPEDQNHREALSQVLENTAFFGDLLLRLPDTTYKIYSKNKDWQLLARWSISFSNETHILDSADSKLLDLMAQELELVPKDPNYINPYRIKAQKEKQEKEDKEQIMLKEKKKKKKRKRGPQLSHGEL